MFAQFSKEECSTYLQYKKQSSKDPGMPRDLQERCARCIEWMARPSPAPSPNVSDDEGEDGEKEGVQREKQSGTHHWMCLIVPQD